MATMSEIARRRTITMMRNEYFSDGFFDGYEWASAQIALVKDMSELVAGATKRIASVPFSDKGAAKDYREGFGFGVKSLARAVEEDDALGKVA